MKTKTWLHTLLHLGCVALLVLQGHRIQQLRQREQQHKQTALAVRQLFFGCTQVMDHVTPDWEVPREMNLEYWKIIGPVPNW